MTRKKVKLAFITNEAARKATFKKRKRGLLKKISELSTLCGIQACAIIYSPYECEPQVWPSSYGVQQVLTKFKMVPEMDQSKKMVNQESFIRQRIIKATDQVKKHRKENRQKEILQVMFQGLVGKSLLSLNMLDLNDLSWVLDDYFNNVLKREETLLKGNPNTGPNPNMNIFIGVNDNNNNNNNSQGGAGDEVKVALAVPKDEVSTPTTGDGDGETAQPVVAQADLERPPGFEMRDRQQWFMEMINPPNQLAFGGGPMGGANELVLLSNQNQSGFSWPKGHFK